MVVLNNVLMCTLFQLISGRGNLTNLLMYSQWRALQDFTPRITHFLFEIFHVVVLQRSVDKPSSRYFARLVSLCCLSESLLDDNFDHVVALNRLNSLIR